MEQNGLYPKALAKKAKLGVRVIQKMMASESCDISTIKKVAFAMGIDMFYLLNRDVVAPLNNLEGSTEARSRTKHRFSYSRMPKNTDAQYDRMEKIYDSIKHEFGGALSLLRLKDIQKYDNQEFYYIHLEVFMPQELSEGDFFFQDHYLVSQEELDAALSLITVFLTDQSKSAGKNAHDELDISRIGWLPAEPIDEIKELLKGWYGFDWKLFSELQFIDEPDK